MKEETPNNTKETGQMDNEEQKRFDRSKKMLLYLGIFSIVMFFAGLTSAYIVSQSSGFWVAFSIPSAFWGSTVFIILSSITLQIAYSSIKKNEQKKFKSFLLISFLFGVGFSFSQVTGWGQLVDMGHHLSGNIRHIKGDYGKDHKLTYKGKELRRKNNEFFLPDDEFYEEPVTQKVKSTANTASSYIYIMTFAHLAHLFGGLIWLILILSASFFKNKYSSENYLKVYMSTIYWHFLGGLWLYLLLFFVFIH